MTREELLEKRSAQVERDERALEVQAGRMLITQLAALERLLHIYEPQNDTVSHASRALMKTIDELLRGGSIEIRLWRDCIFINGERMRCDVSNFSSYKHLLAKAKVLKIEKITFETGLSRDEIVRFLKSLTGLEDSSVSGSELAQEISQLGFDHITITPSKETEEELENLGIKPPTPRERARRAFFTALATAREVLMAPTNRAAVSLRKARRAVQAAADALLEDESSVLALTAIKDHDEYTFTHSVNVCILALAIAQRLGLHRMWQARLGLAAMMHDIGKVAIPPAILNKVGVLDVNEWKAIRDHTLMGVRHLSRIAIPNEQVLHAMIVAFQHHINIDLSGYPKIPSDMPLDLFSRIIRIADTFDAMTTERPYRNKVYSPHDAMRYLVDQAGVKFDPVLVKAFASALGLFPIGTILRLNTGEIGIVVRRSDLSTDPDRAVVRLIADASGNRVDEEHYVDLGLIDRETGEFVYSVTDALSCKDAGINPRDYLLS